MWAMRAVLVVLDAQPLRHVEPGVTPVLCQLAADGGSAPGGGRAVLTSATYPNHASFVTGTDVTGHGLYANHVVQEGKVARAHEVGPVGPTIFGACRDAGRRAVAVLGDHHLVGVMGAMDAASHWPPEGRLPEGRRLDGLGYLHDSGTVGVLCEAAGGPFDLLVSQLNGPDTASHLHGPDSDAALIAFSETDAILGALVDALLPGWDDTVLMVVSDHDQTTVVDDEPIDLQAIARAAGVTARVVLEGDGAVVVGEDPSAGAWLDDVPGIAAVEELAPDMRFVSAVAGRWFAPAGVSFPLRGVHGGAHTRTQVAVVAGGHPAVAAIAGSLASRTPEAPDWAVTLADLLELELPGATGRSLLA
jgi:predicted AlkP superfamily pyrophosphatase or phosphodiesterase